MKNLLNALCTHWNCTPTGILIGALVFSGVALFIFVCACLVVAARDNYYGITP